MSHLSKKIPNYEDAVNWIADNEKWVREGDEADVDDDPTLLLGVEEIASLVSVFLVAELWDVKPEKVAVDVYNIRLATFEKEETEDEN